MDIATIVAITIPSFTILCFLVSSIKIIYQFERGVKFTLGKYSGLMLPGLRFLVPLFQTCVKVDIRQNTIDLQPQKVLTKDQVSLKIDGVVFYVPEEPEKMVLNVSSLRKQIEDKATSELKDIIGDMTMTESLSSREKISKDLMLRLNTAVEDKGTEEKKRKDWGVIIKAIQINNIELPPELIRAMAKKAEAEREADARKTKAEGEKAAANSFKEAALIYASTPQALRLRELQTFQEIGTEHNSLMLVIPSSMAEGDGRWTLPLGMNQLKKSEATENATEKIKK